MVTAAPAVSDVWQPWLADIADPPFTIDAQTGPFGEMLVTADGSPAPVDGSPGWIAPLSDLMVLKVSGDDALSFLQGQLTNSLEALDDGMAQRTGLCSPKGRLLADFIAARIGPEYFLLLSSAIAESVHKRLAMFVLRAKVGIENVTQAAPPIGMLSQLNEVPGGWPGQMVVRQDDQSRLLIGLESVAIAGQSQARVIVLSPSQTLADDLQNYRTQGYSLAPTAWWHATEALAGTPRIGSATSDAFVPQMINFELIGGVSFQKGCFPGQEVVARMQYLGKLKRRLQAGWVSAAANGIPGSEVLDSSGSAVGTIVLAGPGETIGQPARQLLLFETRLAALEDGGQLLVDGHEITLTPLPYEIPVAERFVRPDL